MGSIFGSSQSKEQKANTSVQTQIAQQQEGNAQFAAGQAEQTLPQATSNLNTSGDFWKAILQGSGADFDKYTASTKNSINESFDAARKTITEFGPRGGGSNSGESEAETKRATSLSSLVFGAQGDAANSLASIGSAFGSIGTAELNAATGAGSSASGTLGGINSQISADNAAQAQKQQQAGAAMAQLLLLLAA